MLTLVVVECEALSDPENGNVQVTSTVYLSTALYTCFEGYVLTGNVVLRCEANGDWSSDPPTCSRKKAANVSAVVAKILNIHLLYHPFVLVASFSLSLFSFSPSFCVVFFCFAYSRRMSIALCSRKWGAESYRYNFWLSGTVQLRPGLCTGWV